MTDTPNPDTSHRPALHDHYARNAKATGHSDTCEKVTRPINWPTICGRPQCTCQVTS